MGRLCYNTVCMSVCLSVCGSIRAMTFEFLEIETSVLVVHPSGNKRYTFETSRQMLTSIDATRLTPVAHSMLFIVECLKWGMHVRCEHQCVSDLELL